MNFYLLFILVLLLLFGCLSPQAKDSEIINYPKETKKIESPGPILGSQQSSLFCKITSKNKSLALPQITLYIKSGNFREELENSLFDTILFKDGKIYYSNDLYPTESCKWLGYDLSKINTNVYPPSTHKLNDYDPTSFDTSCEPASVDDSLFKIDGGICDLSTLLDKYNVSICSKLEINSQKEECEKLFSK